MAKSMTGFGRAEVTTVDYKVICELKSVNHRYCDISVKIPKKLSYFESVVRNELKKYISRGKVDVFISYEDYTQGRASLKYNKELAASYIENMKQLSSDFLLDNMIDAYKIARFPEVFSLEDTELDQDKFGAILVQVVDEAAERFVASRITEGELLKKDLQEKLDSILETVSYIEKRSPEITKEYREKILAKVEELLGDRKIDDSILATELVVYSDKICVDEEIVRLKSHVLHMKETLENADSVGRKLDFIAQEMNRESNTILSKANDIEISNHAIDLKTEIEKIREQIQNIE